MLNLRSETINTCMQTRRKTRLMTTIIQCILTQSGLPTTLVQKMESTTQIAFSMPLRRETG